MIIQKRVVQRFNDGADDARNLCVVNHPVFGGVKNTLTMDTHPVGMPVHSSALVARWNLGELVSCLEGEVLPEFESVV